MNAYDEDRCYPDRLYDTEFWDDQGNHYPSAEVITPDDLAEELGGLSTIQGRRTLTWTVTDIDGRQDTWRLTPLVQAIEVTPNGTVHCLGVRRPEQATDVSPEHGGTVYVLPAFLRGYLPVPVGLDEAHQLRIGLAELVLDGLDLTDTQRHVALTLLDDGVTCDPQELSALARRLAPADHALDL